jgi:TfuA protein
MNIKVYSQLTLDAQAIVRLLPGATPCPPIRRQDLLRDIRDGVHVVAIVDGAFEQSMAVSGSEIMDALRAGVVVYGASSMGALRAAELHSVGMIGHGRIFERVARDPFFRDDFLGQMFAIDDGRIRALSQPYVDFEINVERARTQGLVSTREASLLCRLYADLFYADRCWPALRRQLDTPRRRHLFAVAKAAIVEAPSQKREDAIGLLRRIRRDLDAVRRWRAA